MENLIKVFIFIIVVLSILLATMLAHRRKIKEESMTNKDIKEEKYMEKDTKKAEKAEKIIKPKN